MHLVQFGRLVWGRVQFGGALSLSVIDVLNVVAVVCGCRVTIMLAYLVVSVWLLFVMTVRFGVWRTVMATISAWHMRFAVAVMIRSV